MKKRLLFAYPEMMVGGSTTSLISLLNTIDYKLYEVDLILYKNRGVFLKDIPKEVNILKEACKYPSNSLKSNIKKFLISLFNGCLLKALLNDIRYRRKISLNPQTMAYTQTKISRKLESRYDVAIGYLELWSDIYVLNNVIAKKKIIWIHVDFTKAGYIPIIDRKQFEKSDIIVCVSEECLKNFKNEFPSLSCKAISMDNILSFKYIDSKSMEQVFDINRNFKEIKLLTVCRISIYHKGLDRAVLAMKRLYDEGYNVKWYLIGDGSDRDKIENLILHYSLKDKFILLGNKVNPYPYYRICDAFVLPSRYEGKPMVITEAQMLGLPVIVTKYSSAEEQINNNTDGIIVDNDDTSIYYGIRKILDEAELLSKFKLNLQNRNLSNEYVINQFYELLG